MHTAIAWACMTPELLASEPNCNLILFWVLLLRFSPLVADY
jgi:hypothetical protein